MDTQFKDWHFANDDDKELGIETMIYENGHKSKRCKLSDGRTAVCRVLKGKDARTISRLIDGDAEKYQQAVMTLAIKIDDKAIVIENLDEMLLPDYTNLIAICDINFPSTQNV